MIGSLRGNVAYMGKEYCLVENHGIGYRVFMPASNLAQIKNGEEVFVHIFTSVKEDAILLYGFLTREYYNLFILLTSVSGVGPKVALGILSAGKPEQFYLNIRHNDVKALTALPGIGRKTAERLVLELKDKLGQDVLGEAASASNGLSPDDISVASGEALEALRSLGYTTGEIMTAFQKIGDLENLTTEAIIKQALQVFAGRK